MIHLHRVHTPHERHHFYQRWTAVLAFVIIGQVAISFRIGELKQAEELVSAGIPVSGALAFASIVGIIMSLIIFRTPHDGQTEL